MDETYQTKFFVAYPRNNEDQAKSIMEIINKRLMINYRLWSYQQVDDEADYFEKTVSPIIENADFVVLLLSKNSISDYIVTETNRYCSNLNKRVIAIKVGYEKVKSKDWNLRSDIIDFSEESERMSAIVQIHGLLGLRKVGDIYGANVAIKSDIPCTVFRNNEVLGQTRQNSPVNCVLSEGTDNLTFKFGEEWNSYDYYVPNNDCEVEFEASLSGTKSLSKVYNLPVADNIEQALLNEWNWDVTGRNDFVLVASSQDDKKREVIHNSYNTQYLHGRKGYPKFEPEEIKHSTGWEVFAWIMAILIGIIGKIVSGIIVISIFYWLRKKKDKRIMRRNEHRRKELISDTDNYNYKLWDKINTEMNKVLSDRNLASVELRNLGTPR